VQYATNLPDLLRLGVQMILRGGHVEYATDLPNLLRLPILRPVWAMLILHRSLRLLMCQRLLIMCQGRKGLG
jgi:hypothetical protein